MRQTTRSDKEAAESEIICTLDSRLLAYTYGSLNDLAETIDNVTFEVKHSARRPVLVR